MELRAISRAREEGQESLGSGSKIPGLVESAAANANAKFRRHRQTAAPNSKSNAKQVI